MHAMNHGEEALGGSRTQPASTVLKNFMIYCRRYMQGIFFGDLALPVLVEVGSLKKPEKGSRDRAARKKFAQRRVEIIQEGMPMAHRRVRR